MVEHKIPQGIKDVLDDLNDKGERRFELRKNQLRRRVDLLLDNKGEVDEYGVRSTPTTEILRKRQRYQFWVTEEHTDPNYGPDFLIFVQPLEVDQTQPVIAYKISSKNVTDMFGTLYHDEDIDLLGSVEEIVGYFEQVMPDRIDGPKKKMGDLRPVRVKTDLTSN